jgi:dipeptidyl aminopeptidase/acylaminoacyl peptidase
VQWAVARGIADPRRTGIMGESYGGYAVLAGLVFTPEQYAAGVAINAMSDLVAHTQHWFRLRPAYRERIARMQGGVPVYADGPRAGEVKDAADWTEADRAEIEFLRCRSPLHCASRLRAPLLVVSGARDTRALTAQSEAFVEAARAAGADVELAVFDDEGHVLTQPETWIHVCRRAEQLFARTLGGRCEN